MINSEYILSSCKEFFFDQPPIDLFFCVAAIGVLIPRVKWYRTNGRRLIESGEEVRARKDINKARANLAVTYAFGVYIIFRVVNHFYIRPELNRRLQERLITANHGEGIPFGRMRGNTDF